MPTRRRRMSVVSELNDKFNYSKSENMCMSEDIRQIAQALLLAKRAFGNTGMSGKNRDWKYAKLHEIYDAVESHLADNNIIIWHGSPVMENGVELLNTRLIHTLSGQYMGDWRIVQSEKPGNQGIGGALTYMRRYSVLNVCGIAPAEDDDGDSEQQHIAKHGTTPKQYTKPTTSSPLITDEHHDELVDLINQKRLILERILSFNKVQELHHLTEDQYHMIMKNILKK